MIISENGPNPQLYIRKDGHWDSTKCKWVYSMNSPFIANLGHPWWGSQSMQEFNSCIDCEPHQGWPRFAMNGLFIFSNRYLDRDRRIVKAFVFLIPGAEHLEWGTWNEEYKRFDNSTVSIKISITEYQHWINRQTNGLFYGSNKFQIQ